MCACSSLQLCPTLCDPVDFSPPVSSVHGILQARILEWVAVPSSRGSSQPRDQIQFVFIAGRFSIAEPLGKEDNSKPGFLNLCAIDTLGQITLCWGWGALQCILGYLAALQPPRPSKCQCHPSLLLK